MVGVKIDFEELLDAFDNWDVNQHYYIDVAENSIVYVNENVEMDASERIERLEADNRYIAVPHRMPWDDRNLMEYFAYDLGDLTLAGELLDALADKMPYKVLNGIIRRAPEVEKKWYGYRDKHIRNELINWLLDNDIRLIGQSDKMLKEFNIRELSLVEVAGLGGELAGFMPRKCMGCGRAGGFSRRIFSADAEPENRLDELHISHILSSKFGVRSHGLFSTGERVYLTASKCQKCRCEEIIWDY